MATSLPPAQHPARLNPFALPAETDLRYLTLVLVVFGATLGIGFFSFSNILRLSFGERLSADDADLIAFFAALILTIAVFLFARYAAGRDAEEQIAREGWQAFPPSAGDAYVAASLAQMAGYVETLMTQVPNLGSDRPRFYWADHGADAHLPGGMAFGYARRYHVMLQGGMHAAFLRSGHNRDFIAVLLHELGHLANCDVDKTVYSLALSRIFTRVSVAVVALNTLHFLSFGFQRLVSGRGLDRNYLIGSVVYGGVILLLGILLAFVDYLRSSILRVREFYADARASAWLGSSEPIIRVLESSAAQAAPTAAPDYTVAARLRQMWRKRVAPRHPAPGYRIRVARDTGALFHADNELALVTGLLTGLAVSTNLIVSSAMLNSVNRPIDYLVALSQNTLDLGFLTIALMAVTLLIVLSLGFIGLLILTFSLAPLAGIMGVQLQRAALIASAQPAVVQPLSTGRLAVLALLCGLGIVVGGALAPVPYAFSLWGNALLLAPLFVLGWSSLIFLWLLPLYRLARALYRSHQGERPPDGKRRWFTALSAIALAPMLLIMAATQIFTSALALGDIPEARALFVPVLLVSWPIAVLLSAFIWAGGGFLMWLAGWLLPRPCPHCGAATRTKRLTLSCPACGVTLAAWATLPPAINLPPPPLPLPAPGRPPPL